MIELVHHLISFDLIEGRAMHCDEASSTGAHANPEFPDMGYVIG
jgi:hypothetical protein